MKMRSIGALLGFVLALGCATSRPDGGGKVGFPSAFGGGTSGGGSGTVTSVSGTAPIAVATGTTTPAISIAVASQSVPGSMSAADKLKVDALGWYYTTAVPQMKAICPSCTGFKYIPGGNIPGGVSMVSPFADAVQVGGGVGTVSDSVWGIWTVQNYTQPKTAQWVIAFQGKLPAPTSGKTGVFGLVNAGRTHYLGVAANFTVSSSKFTLGVLGASDVSMASTVNSDNAVHTFVIGSDTTTGVKLSVDGVIAQTQASYTQVNDENMQLGTFSSASLTPGVVVDQAAFGY